MGEREFVECLARLNLSIGEAARLLSVTERTVRRWAEAPKEMPGPAEHALRAWCRLESLGLAWRPDGVAIGEDTPEEIAEHIARCRQHAIELDAVLEKVRRRGGPRAPWIVNLQSHSATLGPIHLSFHKLANGSFSPSHYRRADRDNDLQGDWHLLEDGFVCIATALAEEPRRARGKQPHRQPR